jgi:hypothetical protein
MYKGGKRGHYSARMGGHYSAKMAYRVSSAFRVDRIIFLVLGLLLIYVGFSEKNDAISGTWTLTGLLTSSWGVFSLLLALFWSENLRKYREKD